MTQVPNSTDNCFKKLTTYNGKFINGLAFNFGKPKIFNEPHYSQALLGELFINTRNHIGKYQGFYLLYIDDENDFIRLQVLSKDKKSELHIDTTDINDDKITYTNGAIALKFDDFISFLENSKFFLEA